MDELKNAEQVAKSKSARLQETIDLAAAKKAEREKLTAGVIAKRQKSGDDVDEFGKALEPDLEAKAEAVQAANDAVPVLTPQPEPEPKPDDDDVEQSLKGAFDFINEINRNARESVLREVEMHNAQIDLMQQVISAVADLAKAINSLQEYLYEI